MCESGSEQIFAENLLCVYTVLEQQCINEYRLDVFEDGNFVLFTAYLQSLKQPQVV